MASGDQPDAEVTDATASVPASPRLQLPYSSTFPRDLRVQIFLKPDCTMPFDFVDTIDESDGPLTIKTCIGLRMHVEAGYTVSGISGIFDTVSLEARPGCGFTAFAATVFVPPGYSFRIPDVEFVSEMETSLAQTLIETKHAVMNVSNGDYIVKRRNLHRSVLVESTEC